MFLNIVYFVKIIINLDTVPENYIFDHDIILLLNQICQFIKTRIIDFNEHFWAEFYKSGCIEIPFY